MSQSVQMCCITSVTVESKSLLIAFLTMMYLDDNLCFKYEICQSIADESSIKVGLNPENNTDMYLTLVWWFAILRSQRTNV